MKDNRKGLTLIEILISMAVFGILVITTTNLFFSGLNVWEYGENINDKMSNAEFFYGRVGDDIIRHTPFAYCMIYREDNGLLEEIFRDSLHHDKFADSLKDRFAIPNIASFYNGSSGSIDMQNYFLYSNALADWYNSTLVHRDICWKHFKKDLWDRWNYNIPAFDWNDVALFTDTGFIIYSLGDGFSYRKYRGFSIFYNSAENKVYYYMLKVSDPDSITYNDPEVLLENVNAFEVRYYTFDNDEIPLGDSFTYSLPGLLKSLEINIVMSEDKVQVEKKKMFDLGIKKMQ